MEPYKIRFGIPVVKDVSAGELVNPCKSNGEVEVESSKRAELYKISHTAYGVGKQTELICFLKYNFDIILLVSKTPIFNPMFLVF